MFQVLFLLFLLTNPLVWGVIVKDNNGAFLLDIPTHWKYEKDILGLPHVFMTDEKPFRTTISATITGIEDVKLPPKDLKKNLEQYKNGRTEWAKRRRMKIDRFIPYDVINISGYSLHSVGFEYHSDSKNFFEKTYYFECPTSLIHFKIVGPKDSSKLIEAQKAVEKIKCLTENSSD